MSARMCCPKTFMGHPHLWKFNTLLQNLFNNADPGRITKEIVNFLRKYPPPIDDFPLIDGIYTRTILFRSNNGFEAMAARWSKGAISSIHGHPNYTLYFVAEGRLEIDNYTRYGNQVKKTTSDILTGTDYFSSTGRMGTFDNNIHQVQAIEETLSIHISSDDPTKGEVFSRIQ